MSKENSPYLPQHTDIHGTLFAVHEEAVRLREEQEREQNSPESGGDFFGKVFAFLAFCFFLVMLGHLVWNQLVIKWNALLAAF